MKNEQNRKFVNQLAGSSSPYLLQHAGNPVNWHPWSENIFAKAQIQNKLVLVSIGYSACHWCHVMEHESFEDEQVARLMNEKFICIKVDREEHPDVDHYFMTAVHLMGVQGGWPLNVIALPDGKPIWGGTYFRKEIWMKNLDGIADFYSQNPVKTVDYAKELKNAIEQAALVSGNESEWINNNSITIAAVENWKSAFDMKLGGRVGSPKFPMPVNLDFLLRFGIINNDSQALQFVETTLVKMARGGIYDQLGGGFARYSVDEYWKVPHFEKMLYDNAQLISVYSKAFSQYKNSEFKNVVYETVDFIERELMHESGAFYSSLDADSEGEEGRFYVWTAEELRKIAGAEFKLLAAYFQIDKKGFWENGKNILIRDGSDETFAAENHLSVQELNEKTGNFKNLLFAERSKRIRPGLDDKTLTSWNALTITALAEAFKSFGDNRFLQLALKNAAFLVENVMLENGKLFHSWKSENSSINGFLEDYVFVTEAFIALFEISGNVNYLKIAMLVFDYSKAHFFDEKSGLFYFSEKQEKTVLSNFFQNEDNVIPAANSVMANNLHQLYVLLGIPEFLQMAEKMLSHSQGFEKYPMAYANWGNLLLKITHPFIEIVICGPGAENMSMQVRQLNLPNSICVFSEKPNELPLFQGRFRENTCLIYICRNGACRLPVETLEEARQEIELVLQNG